MTTISLTTNYNNNNNYYYYYGRHYLWLSLLMVVTSFPSLPLPPSPPLSLPPSLTHSLQIYKATADVTSGQLLYDKYSTVADDHLVLRDIVMSRKMPRRLFVQPHTLINNGKDVSTSSFCHLLIVYSAQCLFHSLLFQKCSHVFTVPTCFVLHCSCMCYCIACKNYMHR